MFHLEKNGFRVFLKGYPSKSFFASKMNPELPAGSIQVWKLSTSKLLQAFPFKYETADRHETGLKRKLSQT